MLLPLEEIIDFFIKNEIPILPCHGIQDGQCTCRKGKDCSSPGKHPLWSNWQILASLEKDKILAWIGTGNKAKPINLAIATGRKNHTNGKYAMVVDLDMVNHNMLHRLQAHGQTVTQRSGSGGNHALYWSKSCIRSSVQLVEEKVDTRGYGGIAVIAPSLHKSGNFYEFTCDLKHTEIQDLPPFLEKQLRIAQAEARNKKAKKNKPSPGESSDLSKAWAKKSVTEIRDDLNKGIRVPLGVRNITLHRLLSSDRARGAQTSLELLTKAQGYSQGFEDPGSMQPELDSIVKSVMRYPAYNNSHEKVNEVYFGWLKKNGYKSAATMDTLESLDKAFFETLEPSLDGGVALSYIAKEREDFLRGRGIPRFATYKPQLLAKKLESLGIAKRRTAKGNLWCVKINSVSVQSITPACHDLREEVLEMTAPKELKDENKAKEVKDGDIIDHNGQKVRVEVVKTQTKVKEHSREHLYQGRRNYDYNKAMTALLGRVTDEQIDALETGTLVMDRQKTEAWMSQVKVGDVIGVTVDRYLVEKTHGDALKAVRATAVKDTPGSYVPTDGAPLVSLLMGDIDHARELGLLDILWRDGKPFGEDEFKDMTVYLLHSLDEDPATSNGKGKKKNKK